MTSRNPTIPTRREGPFRFFTCSCGHDQAINENMPWCGTCFVEYDILRSGVRLVPDRRTPRFAWAKAIGRAGGVQMGVLKKVEGDENGGAR
jgi:hypothetical protein